MRVWTVWVALGTLLSASCGDDDGSDVPDAAVIDARLGADSSEPLADAAATTLCGDVPDQMSCLLETEICVLTDTGGSLQPSCEACDQDLRDCASCGALCGAQTCGDSNEPNTIECF